MSEPLTIGNVETYPLQLTSKGREVFKITPDGEIEQDGKNITDDDAAVADALREFIEVWYGLKIRTANR